MAVVHELTWSFSRRRVFEECKRRYYFDYYLAWLGWDRSAAPERQRAYILRKLTRMPMFSGDCVHRALAHWFTSKTRGVQVGPAELEKWAVTELRTGYKQSRDGEWRRKPSKLTHLAEHHYEESVIDEPSGNAREYGLRYVDRIRASISAFYGAPELDRVRRTPASTYLACEELGTIELFGTKVFAVPDFAFREADGDERVWIYDWKTGAPRDDDGLQLALYALYAQRTWKADPERVICVDAYLERNIYQERSFTAEELDDVLEGVRTSIDRMREVHFDADTSIGDASAFPLVPDSSPEARVCRTCNYRELCERG